MDVSNFMEVKGRDISAACVPFVTVRRNTPPPITGSDTCDSNSRRNTVLKIWRSLIRSSDIWIQLHVLYHLKQSNTLGRLETRSHFLVSEDAHSWLCKTVPFLPPVDWASFAWHSRDTHRCPSLWRESDGDCIPVSSTIRWPSDGSI